MFLSLGDTSTGELLVLECINQPSSQCYYHWVDTSTGELFALECINQPSSQCFYHWFDTSTGGLLVLECIISPVVLVSITGSIPLLVDY